MGSKVLSIGAMVVMGWILADALLHPKGVAALGSASNTILATAGQSVTGISNNPNAHVLGG